MVDGHAQKVLEFSEVKALVSKYAQWEPGSQALLRLEPMDAPDGIYELQNKIRQVLELFEEGYSPEMAGLSDLRDVILASTKDIVLGPQDFICLRRNLAVVTALKKSLLTWAHLPFILKTLQELTLIPPLREALDRTFDDQGLILDSASPELSDIRYRMAGLEERIHHKIGSLLRDHGLQKMFQEHLVTMREGRYVIPVKQEYRGVFEGLVLDSSTSGATVFMEPMEVVASNNELRQLKNEEKEEISRILRSLSAMVAQNSGALAKNHEVLAHLDMVNALALFAKKHKAVLPALNSSGYINLKKARHPLLGEKAIPIDIELGRDYSALVITGPNTGGKTVTLKTVGLFAMMALSGMPLIADEGTEIGIFSSIFSDIGDEQSITQNLSTFSSHMSQIIHIIRSVDERSLVLLDELGAGTDPKEGTALGIAILEHLASRGIRSVVTTHYGELKYFAANHPLARNAAMEFDSETLLPSYRVIVGIPGRSCALTIAGKLGLPGGLVKRAEELITHDYVELDRLLEDIEAKEKKMEQELFLKEKFRKEAQALKSRYEEELSQVKTEESEILTEAFSEAEMIIGSAKNEIKQSLKDFRKRMSLLAKSTKPSKEDAETIAQETFSRFDAILGRLEGFRKKKEVPGLHGALESLKAGDVVFIPSMNKEAAIIDIREDEVYLQVEKIKMKLPLWSIRRPGGTRKRDEKPLQSDTPERSDFPERIELLGAYVDEAIFRLGKYMDDALAAGITSFQVVHGKGTGALRKAVHLFLRKHPKVLNFRPGEAREGSWGVTVVTLA
ncbi:MAG: endonuclease MutS2 [Candidatus Eremiobacteraeota bacterium]|nr:endonuclease MutS2 [Candidatus Eremiobacteraeota bacterium]